MDDLRVLTDPVLGQRVAHLWRRTPPIPPLGAVDAVLISHAHHDHLDVRSLRTLPAGIRILAPSGSADVLRKKGFDHVDEVAVGDRLDVGPIEVSVLPAEHHTRRAPRQSESPAVGFRIAGTCSATFFGDTEVFEGMSGLEPSDVALLPIWGWGPSIGPGHMNPERAARAVKMLRPGVAVPIHWGSFAPIIGARHPRFLDWPGPEFARHVARIAPDVEVRVLSPGESLQIGVHPR